MSYNLAKYLLDVNCLVQVNKTSIESKIIVIENYICIKYITHFNI